jgi:hypothetical protein
MKIKLLPMVIFFGLGPSFVLADATSTTNTTTLYAKAELEPGSYSANIMPAINGDVAKRVEKSFMKVPGIEKVTTNIDESELHFTVQKGAKIQLVDLQKALLAADDGAVLSNPRPAHSFSAQPGF